MTYAQHIHAAMLALAEHPKVLFVGYNIKFGQNPAAGTFKGIPEDKLIETPLAENLMAGVAIGLALDGYIPVLSFERSDFLTNAMDAIVNHLDKMEQLSDGEFRPAVIIRVVVGNKEVPLLTGPTHTQDFSDAMEHLTNNIVIYKLGCGSKIVEMYSAILAHLDSCGSAMVFEYKDLYNT